MGLNSKNAQGASANDDECALVEEELELMELEVRGPNIIDYERGVDQGLIRRFDPSWVYYEHLGTLVQLDRISEAELKVVADAMWGAGRGAFPTILSRSRCHITEIRNVLNPGFGGIHPEPIMRYLNELVAAVQREQADIGLATDGDADRIGAIDALGISSTRTRFLPCFCAIWSKPKGCVETWSVDLHDSDDRQVA
jgi:phosphomannomutase